MRPVLIQVVAVTTATILGVQIVAAITAPQLQYPAAANLAAANTNILQQAVQWVENLFRAPTPANEKQTASAAVALKAIPQRARANPAGSPRVLAAATSVPTPVAALPTYITKAQLEARLQQFRNSLPLAVFSPLITPAPQSGYVTQADLASQIAQLQTDFGRTIYGTGYPTPAPNYAGGGIMNSIALATRIDKLSGTSFSDITVDGVSGLSDSDIPNDITASNYLPITGGSITGALTIPYLLATSSTASSFTGNVGIGTTTPFAKLSIHANNGDTNTALFTIASSTASATTTLFTVLNNGKVGIALNDARPAGTSLDVGGTIRSGGANNGGSGVLSLVRRNSGLQWEGFGLGYINFQGTTDNYSSVYTAASIISRSDGDGSAFWGDSSPGSLAFLTTMPGAAHASAARVWITSRGLVGVGNFDDGQDANGVSQFPQHQLDVKITPEATAKTAAFSTLNLANTATSTTNSIIKSGISISSTGSWTGANASNIGVYVSSVTGGTNNYDAIFNGGGNVGIGNTSPTYKLDVTGAGHFTSFVDAANFVATSSATASIFNGGFLSLASSTIGNGTQTGGLTISGGATTTGNAYFAGNVGIGTASPGYKLEVNTGSNQSTLIGNVSGESWVGGTGLSSLTSGVVFRRSSDGTVASGIFSYGDTGGNQSLAIKARVDFRILSNVTTSVIVKDTGNVGIGETAPGSKLSVSGGGSFGSGYDTTAAPTNGLIVEGNVGIGQTSPAYKFDVTGAGHFTSYVDAANFVATSSATASIFNGGFLSLASSTITSGLFSMNGGASTTNVTASGTGWFGNGAFTSTTGTTTIASGQGFTIGGSQFVLQQGSGKVGIGTASPGNNLDITFTDATNISAIDPANVKGIHITNTSGVVGAGSGINFSVNTGANGDTVGILSRWISTNNAAMDFYTEQSTGGRTVKMSVLNTGNVGIGTAAPTSRLEVYDDTNAGILGLSRDTGLARGILQFGRHNSGTFQTTGSITSSSDNLSPNNGYLAFSTSGSGGSATEKLRILGSGNIGIGTTTPYTRLTVWGPDTEAGTAAFLIANSASTTEFAVYDDGSATLAGTLTQNSDVRLKTNVESLDASSTLGLIAQLDPVVFHWADPAKNSTPQLGFIAQDVQKIFPQLVSTTSPTAQTPDGTLGLNYIGFIAPIVEAIKALMAELHDLTSTVAGFTQSFTSAIGNFGQVNTNKLCATDGPGDQNPVCVTKTQLAALLSQSAAAGFANPLPASPTPSLANPTPATDPSGLANPTPATSQPQDTEPPVITINGNNPAAINVGDTYNDLGARVTDNVDSNLGIQTFVGTTPIDQAVIDTSAPATYHINYVATDAAGNTATSTRTVIIEAAAIPPIVPSDSPSTDAPTTPPPPPPTLDASSTPQ